VTNATAETSAVGSRMAEQRRSMRLARRLRGLHALAVRGAAGRAVPLTDSRRHPDEVISGEIAQNAKSWAALRRLGVRDGDELPLVFHFETAGAQADSDLAEFLRSEAGYEIVIERDGLTGWTPPIALGRAALDDWVRKLLYASYAHGGCVFAGWTATVAVGRRPVSPPLADSARRAAL
jgi:hypothetical protein